MAMLRLISACINGHKYFCCYCTAVSDMHDEKKCEEAIKEM
jgi:hypothetical protein